MAAPAICLRAKNYMFAVVLLLGLLAFTARPATDPDLWWHLRTGQWIIENHQIPHTDPFSFTRSGSPWVSHEWLSELLFYELWRHTGWAGLIIFSAVITTTGFMLLFWRCAALPHWAAAATVLGALASAPAWGVRPQMFTFVLASLWLWLLERGEHQPWLLTSIPPLFLLWLNLHAGFALGLALVIAYGVGLVWEALTGESAWQAVRSHFWRLFLTLAACLALVPLNPSGAQLYRYPIDVLRSGEMRSFIVEWHSPDFHQGLYLPLLLVSLTLLISFAWLPVRPRARVLLPLFGAFLAALDAVRHIPIFALLAVPVIASGLPQRQHPLLNSRIRPGRGRFKFAMTGIILLMMALFIAVQWTQLARSQAVWETKMYPSEAVDHMGSSSQGSDRVFAYYDWGGYLIWKLYPKSRVFVDGRADLYGTDLLRQFQSAMQLRPGWQQLLDTWDIRTVLIPSSSALAQSLSLDRSWCVEYRDSQATLLLRRGRLGETPEAAMTCRVELAATSRHFFK
jgi:hypothetical protein